MKQLKISTTIRQKDENSRKVKAGGMNEKNRCIIVLLGICPKCKTNSDMWIGRKCPNCGYIGIPINDE